MTRLLLPLFLCSLLTGLLPAQAKPNILVFFTDDLDFDEVPRSLYDLEKFASHTGMKQQGYYDDDQPLHDAPQGDFFDNPKMLMPNLEQLAKDGMILDRFYITSPVCTPSRYSILTGRYASRSAGFQKKQPTGSPASLDWSSSLAASESNLPKTLQRAGYVTGMVGKWHNGHGGKSYNAELRNAKLSDPGVNDKVKAAQAFECAVMQKEQGFDYAAALQMGNVGALKAPKELRKENLEWVTQGAIDFLEQDHKKPFYLYVSLPLPHRQYYDQQARNPNAAYWYDYDPRATPGGYLDAVPDCMPSRAEIVRRCDEAGIARVNTMGTYIDESLGAIMRTLDERGLAENTVLVFTSDHQSRAKNTANAAHVPFVIRWPGNVKAGSRAGGLGSNVDLVSTIMEIAGAVDPDSDVGMDGKSMLAMLKGESNRCRESVLIEIMHTRAVVTERYKYIACRPPEEVARAMTQDAIQAMEQKRRRRVSWDGRKNTPHNVSKGVIMDGDREIPAYFDRDQLYDLQEDPFEQVNLANDPAHAGTLTEMQAKLKACLETLPHPFGEFR